MPLGQDLSKRGKVVDSEVRKVTRPYRPLYGLGILFRAK